MEFRKMIGTQEKATVGISQAVVCCANSGGNSNF